MKQHVRKICTLLVALYASLLLSGCASWSHFKLSDEKRIPVPGTIAVISGSDSEFDVKTAEFITKELNENTKFKAMSQKRIGQIIPQYPAQLVDFRCLGSDCYSNPYISDNALANLNALQSRLKTNYVLLVWNENTSLLTGQYGGGKVRTTVFSRLIVYPGREIVGYSFFSESRTVWLSTLGSKLVEDAFRKLLEDNSEKIVNALSGSLKSQK